MSETIVEGKENLAAIFRVSVRTIRNWLKAGMPFLPGDRYDTVQCQTWRAAKKGVRGPEAPEGRQLSLRAEDKDFWDKENKRYQAEIRKLEYRQRLGELVERAEVEALFAARAMAFKISMLGFARSLPPLLIYCTNEREIEEIISRMAREHLENICRPLPEKFGVQAANGDANSPIEAIKPEAKDKQ